MSKRKLDTSRMMPDFVNRLAKTAVMALQFIALTSAAALVVGFVRRGSFTPVYIFSANFLVGTIIIAVSLVMMVIPVELKFDKLTDHTTFFERYYIERHGKKQKKAFEFLFLGLLIVSITGLVQLLVSLVV